MDELLQTMKALMMALRRKKVGLISPSWFLTSEQTTPYTKMWLMGGWHCGKFKRRFLVV